MMEHYCPAGKCECGNCINVSCYIEGQYAASQLYKFEVCPWPSRQVPVKQQPTMTDDDSPNVACYKLGYDVGFNIGFRAALQQCREAVGKLKTCYRMGVEIEIDRGVYRQIESFIPLFEKDEVLAAISKVGEGMK